MPQSPIIDTHLHVIDRAALDYPWLKGVPPLNRDFLWAEYQNEAKSLGIAQSLFMEVDVAPTQNLAEMEYVRKIAGENRGGASPQISGAIIACRPESMHFLADLDKISGNPAVQGWVKGVRRVLHVMELRELQDMLALPLFQSNICALAERGLNFDLCIPIEAAAEIAHLIDQAPNVTFILDHAGRPNIVPNQSEQRILWQNGLKLLAKRPNLAVKISGLVDRAVQDWSLDDLRPFVETTIEIFGWSRVVWGSDWPVCTLAGGLTKWVAASRALLQNCSASEQEAIFHANATKIYRLTR